MSVGSVSWWRWLRQAVQQQAAFLLLLWRDPRFYGPMLALWSSDFGSSVSDPVRTYLNLELGFSPEDIGSIGFVGRFGTIIFAPIYGHSVDRVGILVPLLISIACCGTGCSLQGVSSILPQMLLASVFMGLGGGCTWTMVKGYVASHIDESSRPLVIAGFQTQMIVLSSTSVLYPAFDRLIRWILKTDILLSRYRAAVLFCGTTCWTGILLLLTWAFVERKGKKKGSSEESADTESSQASRQWISREVSYRSQETSRSIAAEPYMRVRFLTASVVLSLTICCQTILTMLWPIYIKHHFGWDARNFAYLSFAQTFSQAVGLIVYPRAIQGRIKQQQFLKILTAVAACLLPGFLLTSAPLNDLTLILRNAAMISCIVLVNLLGSGAETVASLCMEGGKQGGALGVLSTMKALGALCGFLGGPRMWTWSLAREAKCSFNTSEVMGCLLEGGSLPFSVTFLLLAVVMALYSLGELAPHVSEGCKAREESAGSQVAATGLKQQLLN